jgi:uncharacterized protein (DUF2147 family)
MHMLSATFRSFLVLAALLAPVATAVYAQGSDDPARIIGLWLTADGKAHIEVYRTGEKFAGKIVWLKEPLKNGVPAVDDKNPDEKLRGRPMLGMELMYGFVYDEDDVWTAGRVYDPEGGEEYRGKLTLVDNDTMELRGYVMLPLFGRTETWTRVK